MMGAAGNGMDRRAVGAGRSGRRLFLAALLAGAAMATGCSQSAREINSAPDLSPVGAGIDTTPVAYQSLPVSKSPTSRPYSLWSDKALDLYSSQRALDQGDLLTVLISIDDSANFSNRSDRRRGGGIGLDLNGTYDFSGGLIAGDGSVGLGVQPNTSFNGTGSTRRSERVNLSMAAVVTERLPNGNLVIRGSQEVLVNHEMRILSVAGLVRPEDINPDNTIEYSRIAEARIFYGGRGRLTEVQQPGWGQQVVDLVSPF